MNGIYDFEQYRTPYLDVEMLMERKAKKQAQRTLVLACILVCLTAIVSVLLLGNLALISQEVMIIGYTVFAAYVIVGIVLMLKFLKKTKGEVSWQFQ